MTTSAQAYCQRHGHDWSGWSLWRAVMPTTTDALAVASGKKPVEELIYAKVRYRGCRRCGARQSQGGAGEVRLIKEERR